MRNIQHSQQVEMQVAPGARGDELLWGRQPENDKGKCPCDFRQLHLASIQEAIRGSASWSQAARPFIMSEVT
jgi:hypothetical protein